MRNPSRTPKKNNRPEKPKKPRPDFPLFPHASGKWAKAIKGKTYYFGKWDDPEGAEAEYLAVAEDLHAGRTPRPKSDSDGVTLRDICNAFIKSKRNRMEARKLSPRTFVDYDRVCKQLLDEFGRSRLVSDLRISDFESFHSKLLKKYSSSTIGSQITMTRSVFKYGWETEQIENAVKFGPNFKAPDKAELRKAKAKAKHQHGSRTFEAEETRQMLEEARPQLRAMILLGINGGMGNTDIATLPESALDLKNGILDYPRPKTGAERRIPLWPETTEAIEQVLKTRREPADVDDSGLIFLTRLGQRWVRYEVIETKSYGKKEVKPKQDDAIAKATAKLLKKLNLKRRGLSFYSLRHTFETIAGGARDQVAVDAIMGHIDPTMAGNYRHHIEDERLLRVVNHVRDWLFAE